VGDGGSVPKPPANTFAERIAALSPEKRALLSKKMAESAEEPRRLADEPIAIIGIGCRFPGGAEGPEAFWSLLHDGVDAVGELPPGRRGPEREPRDAPRWGGFLREVDRFDAAFFGISPREALQMDPQHRLLLEVAWEAIEDGGATTARLSGSRTGVFASVYHRDYARLALADAGGIDAYVTSGTHHAMASNRLSYVLDLRGPSLTVDTACSSSLVALHLACRSLRQRECDLAIVAAANLVLAPEETLAMSRWGMLSPAGRCRTFDARADGFVRSEGAGALLLQRLPEAMLDGARVRAVVRGSAVNQDGRSNGLTAPSVPAQVAVIRSALDDAAASPAQVGYVEAHGTGTALGDPIEIEALREALGQPRADGSRCAVGAVKTNLGHLEAAAGVAGVIKAVLALEHEEIPPNVHFERLNPAITLTGTPLAIAATPTPWPRGDAPRLCGVSSFGMGGTNAHVILEEAPRTAHAAKAGSPGESLLLVPFSARSASALRALAQAHRDDLAGAATGEAPAAIAELAAATARRRSHHDHRLAVLARTAPELREGLDAFLRDEPRPGTSSGRAPGSRRVVFVFPGQGGQWAGMGQRLWAREPAFRSAMERCEAAISSAGGGSVLAALRARELPAGVSEIQPLLFALQVSLAALFRAWGVAPDAVVGHSMGEVAAAHVAGAVGLEDAARIITVRSRLLERISGQGAMLAVELSREEAARVAWDPRARSAGVSVAAENGPTSTVLSGDASALERIAADLERRAIMCRRVKVDVASHSPFVDPLRADLLHALAATRAERIAVPMISTVTGRAASGPELDAAYWFENLRATVRFWPAVEQLRAEGHDVFLELGPHPILLPALEAGLPASVRASGSLLPAMRRHEDDQAVALGSLGALYTLGASVRWEALHPALTRHVALPRYPWQRERHWIRTPPAEGPSSPAGRHPLLGPRVSLAHTPGSHVWEGDVDPARLRFLGDHRVQGAVVMPGTACLEMALAAAVEAFGEGPHAVEDVVYTSAIFLPEAGARTLQVALVAEAPDRATFQVHGRSSPHEGWVLHARGGVRLHGAPPPGEPLDLDAIQARCGEPRPGSAFYAGRAALGNGWGAAFQGVLRFATRPGEILAEVSAPPAIASDLASYAFHPALLDACGQALAAAAEAEGAFVLARVGRFFVYRRPGARLRCHIVIGGVQEPGCLEGDVHVLDERGEAVAEIAGLRLRFLDRLAPRELRPAAEVYETRWVPVPEGSRPTGSPGLLVLADEGGVGERLADLAAERGLACTLALPGASFAELGPRRFRFRPDHRADLAALLAAAGAGPGTRIVHLSGLGAPRTELAARRTTESALHLAQEMGKRGDGARLWLVTRGAQAILPGERVATAEAPLWGLGRSLGAEHPARLGGLVDLDPRSSAAGAALALLDALEAAVSTGGAELALRGEQALAPRLVRREAPSVGPALRLLPDRSYLVTGGLGELGLRAAERLVERGARHLVLLGRSALPPRASWSDLPPGEPAAVRAQAVRALEAKGASVHLAAVDVGDEIALAAFLDGFAREGRPPIRGVIHAAGVQHAAPLDDLDDAAVAADFRGKVGGALLLDRLIAGPLDFFVLFSSAAALVPSPFLASYAAASALLGALAADRRARGEAALSVSWGFWDAGGMAARYEAREARGAVPRGMASFAPAEALDVLESLVQAGGRPSASPDQTPAAEAAVVAADWIAFGQFHPEAAASPLLTDLVRGDGEPEARAGEAPGRAALLEAEPAERQRLLQRYLAERVARTLRVPAARLPRDEPLVSLGLDSLMAIELKNRIEADLGLIVPIVRILGCPGVDRLVEPVLEALAPQDPDGWETLTF
jgi:myxalamid-type polyketide synthase MxaE and MxaD